MRDLVIQPRDNDLVLATHGRGIWIIDDITPLRALTPELLTKKPPSLPRNRCSSNGSRGRRLARGRARLYVGDNPPDAAVITYYQRSRHLFGKLKIEVLDASGRVVDKLPASKRPGLNRVNWSMHEKPPRVPPAAQIAGAGIRGPRVLPGTYTVRMTKNGKVLETKLTVGLDRPVKIHRRRSQGAVRCGDESARAVRRRKRAHGSDSGFARTPGEEQSPACRRTKRAQNASDFDDKVDAVRKQIVATTEGGAITGEERLREHTDQLYGAILSYEGQPADYQIARIATLRRELDDVAKDCRGLRATELPKLDNQLKEKGQPAIEPPPAKVAVNEPETGGASLGAIVDRDLPATGVSLPANFQLLR